MQFKWRKLESFDPLDKLANLEHAKKLREHPAISGPLESYSRHHYSTPLFILRETLNAFQLHNGLGLAASLSFYALFALIPLTVLLFFLISHWVASSDFALVKLAIILSNVLPRFSQQIMIEVYGVAQHRAAWGIIGTLALLWVATPLTGALRSAFHTLAAIPERPSFFRKKFKDAFAVLAMLFLLSSFSGLGLALEEVINFLRPTTLLQDILDWLGSLGLMTLLIGITYRTFFPVRADLRHIGFAAFATALLWAMMKPLFAWFLSANPTYGAVFGGMKNLFISIGWLYYTFGVFLLGIEMIATLHKKDILLLRGLFGKMPSNQDHYFRALMARYGKTYQQGETIFEQGESGKALYFLVRGSVVVNSANQHIRELHPGDYFGEMAMLADTPRIASAKVLSDGADVIEIEASHLESILLSEPKIAMQFLKRLATQLNLRHSVPASEQAQHGDIAHFNNKR